jgi:hypothetical protein
MFPVIYTNMDNTLLTLNQLDNLSIAQSFECLPEDLYKHTNINKFDFTIVTQNIRSIYSNIDDLRLALSSLSVNIDILILSECRLNPIKPIPPLDSYSTFSTTNHLNQNDGVVTYIKNTHKAKVKEVKLSQASCLEITVSNIKILGIYRSPSNHNTDSFISSLSDYLETIKINKNIIITGDININIIHKLNEQSQERTNRLSYLNMLSMHGLLPGHLLPTRDKTCLDHVMLKIDKSKTCATVGVLNTSITDHFMVFLKLSKINTINNDLRKTKTVTDFENALCSLSKENLSNLHNVTDPNILADLLISSLRKCLLENTIITLIPRNNRIIKPWITLGILRCIRNRNNMQMKLRSDPDNITLKITYRRYRNYCNNLIKKLKRTYDKEQLAKAGKNPKHLWKSINNITSRKPNKTENSVLLDIRSTPIQSVNTVNIFFASVGKSLAENILSNNANQVPSVNKPSNPSLASFVLLETDPTEIHMILMSLKSDSAPGWDNVSAKFLKMASGIVVPIITNLVNICFKNGIFPNALKKAIITPVFKSGNKEDPSNYRPISVLPAISKILEKLINNRILNYLNKFGILSSSQYGFRQGLSTEDAVTALSSIIVDKIDKNKKCLTVFLDLKKAFDTVSVASLADTLENIGIRDIPLKLMKDYLHNRIQKVKIGNHISNELNITFGVPQGSVLGPTLFLVYINQLCGMEINNGRIFSYADDTALVFYGDTWEDVRDSAEKGLSKVAYWLNSHLLTLNTSKTNYICFTNYNSSQPGCHFRIKIHTCNNNNPENCSCSVITKVESTKYLGVLIDQRLTWHLHTELIMTRLRKLIWIFKNLRHIATKTLLKQIYLTLIQSILTYCIPVWGGATKTKFLELERAQRTVLKVMHFKPFRHPTLDLYMLSDVLSVRKLYVLFAILRLHKSIQYSTFTQNRRRNNNMIPTSSINTTFASRQFVSRSAKLYNIINKQLNIYHLPSYECKKKIYDWLKPKSYYDIENLFQNIFQI